MFIRCSTGHGFLLDDTGGPPGRSHDNNCISIDWKGKILILSSVASFMAGPSCHGTPPIFNFSCQHNGSWLGLPCCYWVRKHQDSMWHMHNGSLRLGSMVAGCRPTVKESHRSPHCRVTCTSGIARHFSIQGTGFPEVSMWTGNSSWTWEGTDTMEWTLQMR